MIYRSIMVNSNFGERVYATPHWYLGAVNIQLAA